WFRVTARYIPPPPGVRPPALWGTEERLRELFGKHTTQLEVMRRSFVFRYRSAQDWLDYFKTYFGPFKGAFDTLDAAAQETLAQAMLALVQQFNRSGDETIVAPSDYLEMVAIKL